SDINTLSLHDALPIYNAKNLIEDFMIAANGVTARYLKAKGFPSMRRVVRSPERWDRIEAIARELDDPLPPDPDPVALEQFLVRQIGRAHVRVAGPPPAIGQ